MALLQDLSGFDHAGGASTSGRGADGEEGGDGAARRSRKPSGGKHGRKGSRGRSRGPQVPDEIPEVRVRTAGPQGGLVWQASGVQGHAGWKLHWQG